MRRHRSRRLAPALIAIVFSAGFASSAARVPHSARALAAGLKGGHRAEAQLAYTLADPLGGAARAIQGKLALEPPDRLRLDFSTTGESVALRGDGGEWLQPAQRQLIRIPADRAVAALAWGRVLLPSAGATFHEDSLAPRRFRLTPDDPDDGPPVLVELDAHGLPARLTVESAGADSTTYRFSNWRFVAARGAVAYRISAPQGYDAVDLP